MVAGSVVGPLDVGMDDFGLILGWDVVGVSDVGVVGLVVGPSSGGIGLLGGVRLDVGIDDDGLDVGCDVLEVRVDCEVGFDVGLSGGGAVGLLVVGLLDV